MASRIPSPGSKPERRYRMVVNVIVVATVVVAVVLIVRKYILAGGKAGCCEPDESVRLKGPKDKDVANYPHEYKVEVTGMSCDNCANKIANSFNAENGTFAEVSLKDGEALVHTKETADANRLKQVVRNAGYGVGQVVQVK